MLFTRELSFDPEMALPLPTYPVLGKGQINSWSVATVGKHHVGMRIKATRNSIDLIDPGDSNSANYNLCLATSRRIDLTY